MLEGCGQVNPDSHDLMEHVLDIDSHEMAPTHFWRSRFGPAAGEIADLLLEFLKVHRDNQIYVPNLTSDSTPITPESVWFTKGPTAPGAIDFQRRTEVMDQMGISRQLVFPAFAIVASDIITGDEDWIRKILDPTGTAQEIRDLARAGLDEYNEWAAATTSDRIRCVAYIVADGTVGDLTGQAENLISKGIRAIDIPHGVPPAGLSPADPAMDEFWALLERHDVPLVTHIGNEQGFITSNAWKRAPAFQGARVHSQEFGAEPYSFATLHHAAENFLTVLVLGGVFERFPALRVGMIEQGCSWLGPFAENLDMWARDVYPARLKPFISMLPSQYINRNVRVTPFNGIEQVRREFERYPHLTDSYCYSTDYPHAEGGKDSKRKMYEQVSPLGEEIVEKFFVTNAELVIPA
jgi:predicted TIM-barrel fold metal-dependent hydrolase